jgi:hypothetical protein
MKKATFLTMAGSAERRGATQQQVHSSSRTTNKFAMSLRLFTSFGPDYSRYARFTNEAAVAAAAALVVELELRL